jgi:hypothetical protein
MDFRWIIAIALWTMLIGPVFGPPLPRPVEKGRQEPFSASAGEKAPDASGQIQRR